MLLKANCRSACGSRPAHPCSFPLEVLSFRSSCLLIGNREFYLLSRNAGFLNKVIFPFTQHLLSVLDSWATSSLTWVREQNQQRVYPMVKGSQRWDQNISGRLHKGHQTGTPIIALSVGAASALVRIFVFQEKEYLACSTTRRIQWK